MPNEVMGWPGPLTHRQMRTLAYWLDDQFHEPDLLCWYMMQNTQAIYQVNMKKQAPPISTYRLKLVEKKVNKEQVTVEAKSRWIGFIGSHMPIKHVKGF